VVLNELSSTEINTETRLKQLAMDYKKSEAYELFGGGDSEDSEGSTFWRTSIGCVGKYKMAVLPKVTNN
jgi:hypothetical protein